MTIRLVIAGVTGRMGQDVLAAASTQPDVSVIGGLVRSLETTPGTGSSRTVAGSVPIATLADRPTWLADADVLIDFTTPAAAISHAQTCAEAGVAFVSGTTGLSASSLDELRVAASRIPVLYARNMSLGVAALLRALPTIAATLDGFDVEVIETHHRHKADAPSGTALALAEAIAAGPLVDMTAPTTFGRHGKAPRQPGEIGIHAVRAGGNPGEHQIIFASDGEEIRLSHRAFSRRAYAEGALRAARFLIGRQTGFYGVHDVLNAASAQCPPA